MKAIINATLVMKDHYIPDGVICIENDTIVKLGTKKDALTCEASEIIDAKGLYVGAGFVDIHTHAGGDADFMKDPCKAAKNHLVNGTTSVMPALYFDMNTEQYVEAIKLMKKAMSVEKSNIPGIYMEGPYLNSKFGADKNSVPWKGVAHQNEYMPIINEAWDVAKVWALAPETENILEFVKDVKSKNPNAVFSVAHSEASPQQIEAIMPYGLKIGTHHTNATGDRPRYPECRGVCVDEAVNYNREIYAELICDSLGIHVDPYMLRLVRRIKGDDRIILISDACTPQGPVPEGYEGVTDINFDYEGEISGSNMTLNVACRNMMKHTGASVVDVFNYASYNPARAVGLIDRGSIEVGKRADLVFVNHNMDVSGVIIGGESVNL